MRVATGDGDKIAYIWHAHTGRLLNVLCGHEDTVFSTTFSPGGSRVITASEDQTARIWDAATRVELMILLGHDWYVHSATRTTGALL
jgi:WD40 repeat protein